MPEGEFDDLALLSEDKKARLGEFADANGYAAPVFSDEVIVVLPETQLLTVLERDTADVLWQQRLPKLKDYPRAPKEPQGLCQVAQLPDDATVLTVVVGRNCSTFLHYDLATGDLLGKEQRLTALEVSEITPVFSIARETYWVDVNGAIYRFDGAGESQAVLSATALALDSDKEQALDATVIAGTDVVVLKLLKYGSQGENSGRYVGIRIGADNQAEVLWSQQARKAIQSARPRGRYVDQAAAFLPELRGHLLTPVRRDGLIPRINRFDPESGALDSGLILEQDPDGGFPGWAIATGFDNVLPLADGIVSASGYDRSDSRRDVTFYDYSNGQVRWSTRPKMEQDFGDARTDPMGVSSDGAFVYVSVTGDNDTVLLELDATTGRETRRWIFTLRVTSFLTDSFGIGLEVVIDGDRMVWLRRSVDGFDRDFAAVFALPEPA